MTSTTSSFAVTAIVVAACILFAAVVLFATWRYMRRDDDLFPFEDASAEWARALNPNVSRAGSTVSEPVAGTGPGHHARQAGRDRTAGPVTPAPSDPGGYPYGDDLSDARRPGRIGSGETSVSSAGPPRPFPCCLRCARIDPGDPCQGCYCHEDDGPTLTTMLAIHARDRREFLAAGLGHTRDLLARAEAVLAVTG